MPIPNDFFHEKRQYFDGGNTLSYSFRIEQLKKLKKAIVAEEEAIAKALHVDLKKSPTEAYFTEIGFVLAEIDHTLKHLKSWMRPERQFNPIIIEPSRSEIRYNPKGVVFIISPWNYPFQLVMAPLIGAIAAGNCAVIKPSEDAPKTAQILERIIASTFPKEYISIVQGLGHEVVPAIIKSNIFNHIFFTGSPHVGKIIAGLAAESLTSTTLELGGKCPAIVDSSANLKVAAKRIAWGKLLNAGQTCISPDYLLVEPSIKGQLVEELKSAITEMFGSDPQQSDSYPRLINSKRYTALAKYLDQGRVLFGGQRSEPDLYIAPTIIDEVSVDDSIMQEEIFGPILPILTFESNEELLNIVRQNRYPLACYYFGTNAHRKELVLDQIAFGGGCINDTMVQMGNPDLPFGGVQGSGSGSYHGKTSFTCFSNSKSVVHASTWIDPFIRYAPFSEKKKKWLKWLMN